MSRWRQPLLKSKESPNNWQKIMKPQIFSYLCKFTSNLVDEQKFPQKNWNAKSFFGEKERVNPKAEMCQVFYKKLALKFWIFREKPKKNVFVWFFPIMAEFFDFRLFLASFSISCLKSVLINIFIQAWIFLFAIFTLYCFPRSYLCFPVFIMFTMRVFTACCGCEDMSFVVTY